MPDLSLLNTYTLIFLIGAGNLIFAILAWTYLRTQAAGNLELRVWQRAKLALGIGTLMSWMLPQLPLEFRWIGFCGAALQTLGIAVEFMAYAEFFHYRKLRALTRAIVAFFLIILIALFFFDQTRNIANTYRSAVAGIFYIGMAYLMLKNSGDDRLMRSIMGVVDLIGACSLFLRVTFTFSFAPIPAYSDHVIIQLIYLAFFMSLMINGFGFLLLVKKRDDISLRNALAELSRRDQLQREMLTTVAHEFRTPAAHIKASLDSLAILAKDFPLEILKRHENMRRATTRLIDLSNTLITRDRLIDRSLQATLQPVDLVRLLKEVQAYYPASHEISLDVPAKPVIHPVDPGVLRIALHNLIDNALEHSPAAATVQLLLVDDIDAVVISVADRGKGIPQNQVHSIFERHFSLSGKVMRGLGLSIVRSVAQAHGGEVSVRSNIPYGSIFLICLKK